MGKVSIKESYIRIKDGEVFILNMHINPYEKGNIFNKDPLRTRKLLLHKREISKLMGAVAQKGYTIVPLKVYLKGSLVKVLIGVAKGKKLYDKREDIARRIKGVKLKKNLKLKTCISLFTGVYWFRRESRISGQPFAESGAASTIWNLNINAEENYAFAA